MNFNSISISYVTLISLILISESIGLTTDLIRIDSHHSPFHDASSPPTQRLINALTRSVHRAQRLNQLHRSHAKLPQPDLTSGGGEYLMKFSIGTPPVPAIAIADTGSDVVWTQCRPCLQCINQSLPLFSSRASASYLRVHCESPICHSLHERTRCSNTRRNCRYFAMYGDGSYSDGILATEKFTFPSAVGEPIVVPDVLFGCGFRNGGLFSGIESGIVGLGGGKASLVRQLGHGKFSYCLVPVDDHYNSSKLNFGGEAEVSGDGAVTTPLVVKKGMETFYYVTMEGISVGKERVKYHDDESQRVREGNVIIDSGTTVTMIPSSLYEKVAKAVKSVMKLKRIEDPSGALDLCYYVGGGERDFPEMTIHWRGAADVKWGFGNAFVKTSDYSVCLAVVAMDFDGISIFGNLAQANFLVGFDLVKKTVAFKPAHCGKT